MQSSLYRRVSVINTCAAQVGTAVLLNGWQHSGPVRPSRLHAVETVLWSPTASCAARCMAGRSTDSPAGGAACAEQRRAVSRTKWQALCCAGRSFDHMSSLPMQSIIWRLTLFPYYASAVIATRRWRQKPRWAVTGTGDHCLIRLQARTLSLYTGGTWSTTDVA